MPCPASTKLMRRSRSAQYNVTVTTTLVQLVQYNPNRVALVISAILSAGLYLGLRQEVTTTTGMLLVSGNSPLILTLGDHGDLVRGPIMALASGGTNPVAVWETLLDDPEVS